MERKLDYALYVLKKLTCLPYLYNNIPLFNIHFYVQFSDIFTLFFNNQIQFNPFCLTSFFHIFLCIGLMMARK